MDFDVFISHSSKDKLVADKVCATLERSGTRCWIAPRDIGAGDEYGAAIIHAIDRCRAMVLIFSSNANASRQVPRELERAVSRGVPILPVRIEDVAPKDSLAYFVGSVHWLDAVTPPLEDHLQQLADSANRLLRGEEPIGDALSDQSPRRLSTPLAARFDRAGSSTWPAIGKFAAKSLIVCAGLLLVTFAASQWFGGEAGPPLAAVAERTVDAPARMVAETPAKTQPVQGASQIAEASKADMQTPADEPVVNKSVPIETGRPIGNVTADVSSLDAPKAPIVVAAAKDVPSPEAAPQPSLVSPSPVLSFGGKDNPLFTAEDANRVEQLAAEKKLVLPKYRIAEIDSRVPAKFRRYIGIWATKIGFNGGVGREGMLIVSDVDAQGEVSGIYMLGPPTPTSFEQRPAFFRLFSGKIKDDILSVVLGTNKGSISFASSNTLFVKWVLETGPTVTAAFYPVWILSEHEGAPSVAQTRKRN
jgi:hypothetical protein